MFFLDRNGREPVAAVAWLAATGAALVAETALATVVMFAASQDKKIPQAVLAQLYGLTRAEAATLNALITGTGLRAVARALKISPNTAKTHLARVLEKTNAGGQGELIRLVCGGPGLVRRD